MTNKITTHTPAMKPVADQIKWLTYQVKLMKRHMPEGVRTGKVSLELAQERIECAESILCALTTKEVAHG